MAQGLEFNYQYHTYRGEKIIFPSSKFTLHLKIHQQHHQKSDSDKASILVLFVFTIIVHVTKQRRDGLAMEIRAIQSVVSLRNCPYSRP
jgi:hypothetical protein